MQLLHNFKFPVSSHEHNKSKGSKTFNVLKHFGEVMWNMTLEFLLLKCPYLHSLCCPRQTKLRVTWWTYETDLTSLWMQFIFNLYESVLWGINISFAPFGLTLTLSNSFLFWTFVCCLHLLKIQHNWKWLIFSPWRFIHFRLACSVWEVKESGTRLFTWQARNRPHAAVK